LIVAAYVIASPMLLLLLSMPLVDCYRRSIIGFRYFYYAVMVTVLYLLPLLPTVVRWLLLAIFVTAG